ncbi:MAG: FMN-binding protein [Cycloclasticus sp.]|nr:FMN-binding protein [Cycloclasticus sp.]MBQ0790346.1 FMN-binding protein [Cycloclasticus sp.]
MNKKIVALSLMLFLHTAEAKVFEVSNQSFLAKVFDKQPLKPKVIWLDQEKKHVIESILQHRAPYIRVKYWQKGTKTAWILNEIGKEKPITVGVVIEQSKIKQLSVLAFRESRGWEVKHDFFTRQFNDVTISDELQLNQTIDGISGATLSVRALTKIARIALYLEQHTQP